MKRLIGAFMLCLVFSLIFLAEVLDVFATGNLIKNSGFEEDHQYWEVYPGGGDWGERAKITIEEVYSGKKSCWTNYGVRQWFKADGGLYYARFYFKVHPKSERARLYFGIEKPDTEEWAYITVLGVNIYYDQGKVTVEPYREVEVLEITPVDRGWYRATFKLRLPEGAYALILLSDKKPSPYGHYFDDVYLGVELAPVLPKFPPSSLLSVLVGVGTVMVLYLFWRKRERR